MHQRGIDHAAPAHPWRELRHLTHVTLRWAHLPAGVWGLTHHPTATVTLAHGLDQAERRCTVAHELEHVRRGPVPSWLQQREEAAVDRAVARKLLPSILAVGEALAWAQLRIGEAAEELWVDEATLRARLDSLHPAERAYLRRRLADHG